MNSFSERYMHLKPSFSLQPITEVTAGAEHPSIIDLLANKKFDQAKK